VVGVMEKRTNTRRLDIDEDGIPRHDRNRDKQRACRYRVRPNKAHRSRGERIARAKRHLENIDR
jgi:hypothetical protein